MRQQVGDAERMVNEHGVGAGVGWKDDGESV